MLIYSKKIPMMLFIVAMILMLAISANASGELTVVGEASLPLVEVSAPHVIDIISGDPIDGNWGASHGVASVRSVDTLECYPFAPFSGLRSVAALTDSFSAGSEYSVERYFNGDPLDLSACANLFFAVALPFGEDCSASVRLTVTAADGSSISGEQAISPSGWNGVFSDISGFEGRNAITRLRFTVIIKSVGTKVSDDMPFTFYLDCVCASEAEHPLGIYRFMTADYIAYGGSLAYDTETNTYRFNVTTGAASPFIETANNNYNNLGEANAIALTISESASVETVTCYYTTDTLSEFSEEHTVTASVQEPGSGRRQTLVFPLDTDYIGNLRFVFNGGTDGDIIIYSVSPSSFASYTPSRIGSLDSCRVSDNRREISVRGTLNAESADYYSGIRLMLYRLKPWQNVTSATLKTLTPVAQTNVAAEFSFKITLSSGDISALADKYTVALKVASAPGGMIILDGAEYISNPEVWSSEKTGTDELLKKGFITSPGIVQILGASRTVTDVALEQLVSLSPTEQAGTVDGISYYYMEDYLEKLDSSVASYAGAGAQVLLRLTVRPTQSTALDSILIHPDSPRNSSYINNAAFNAESDEGVRYLFAAVSFLAERYKGSLCGFLFGNGIDNAYSDFNMGEKNLSQFTDSLVRSYRVVYTAARSCDRSLAVYLSLGNHWNSSLPAESLLRYDSRVLLSSFASAISAQGNIDWRVAVDPGSGIYNMSEIDKTDANDEYVSWISGSDIDMLCGYLSCQQFLYGGSGRRLLLISEDSAAAGNESNWILSYIYNYYNSILSSASQIDGYITDLPFDSADTRRVAQFIDTSDGEKICAELLADTGEELSWEDIIGEENIFALAAVRKISIIEPLAALPENIVGSALLWSFDSGSSESGSSGWKASDGVSSLEIITLSGRGDILSASVHSGVDGGGIVNAFDYIRDLTPAPYLKFDFKTAQNDVGVKLTLIVMAWAGNDYAVAYCPVENEDWHTVFIDFSDFPGIGSVERFKILVCPSEPSDVDCTLLLGPVSVYSTDYNATELSSLFESEAERNRPTAEITTIDRRIVYAVAAVAILALAAEVTYIIIRVRRRNKSR